MENFGVSFLNLEYFVAEVSREIGPEKGFDISVSVKRGVPVKVANALSEKW